MDLEGRLRLRQRLQRHVLVAGHRVVQHRVAVAEGAAFDVFTREAHRDAVGEGGGERQFFGRRPVDRRLVGRREHALLAFAAAFELLVHGEAGRHLRQRVVQRHQAFERHGGGHARGGAARRHDRHFGDVVFFRLQAGVGRFHHRGVFRDQFVRQRGRHGAALHERLGVLLAHGRMFAHALVELRLREGRLVTLVVPVPAVADEVDEEVELEALPVGPREPRRFDAGHRIVGVDVHDRDLEAARQAARVAGRERLVRIGGEAELVVRDDVDRAADVPAGEARQVQRFGDDALAGERRVAVDEDAEHFLRLEHRRAGGARGGAGRARHADEQRVDRLEVARVGRHRDDERLRPIGMFHARAGVVLHVAHPAEVDAAAAREERVLELREDLRVRLAHHVREHVQAAAVRHGDEHVLHARGGGVGDDLVEHRDHQVEAFDREARLAGERALQEALEHLDLRDAVEQLAAVDGIGGRAEAPRLDGFTQPHAFVGHEHLGEVVAARGAVDRAQPLDGLEGIGGAGGHRPADDARGQRLERVGREAV